MRNPEDTFQSRPTSEFALLLIRGTAPANHGIRAALRVEDRPVEAANAKRMCVVLDLAHSRRRFGSTARQRLYSTQPTNFPQSMRPPILRWSSSRSLICGIVDMIYDLFATTGFLPAYHRHSHCSTLAFCKGRFTTPPPSPYLPLTISNTFSPRSCRPERTGQRAALCCDGLYISA